MAPIVSTIERFHSAVINVGGRARGGRIVEFYSIYKLGVNLRKQLLHKSMFKLGAYEGEPTRVTTVGDSVAEHYYGHSPSQRGQAIMPCIILVHIALYTSLPSCKIIATAQLLAYD